MNPGSELVRFVGAAHPLRTELVEFSLPEGPTLAELLAMAQPDPMLLHDAVVFVDDTEIPRENWRRVRPRAGHQVTARVVPYMRGGGGGGGGKSPLRTVLFIAVLATSLGYGASLGGALGFTTASTAAAVGGAMISVAGALVINAIAPIRPNEATDNVSRNLYLTGSRNQLRPFDPIPLVLGYYRFTPPLAARTYTESLGSTNYLRMLLAIGYGELELSDWRIGTTPIENYANQVMEVRPGTGADAAITLYPGVVNEDQFSIEMRPLVFPSEPAWNTRTSSSGTDELSVDILFPRGLMFTYPDGRRAAGQVTLDVQWRKVGDVTWLDLPAGVQTTFPADWVGQSQAWFTPDYGGPGTVTIYGGTTSALSHGMRWSTGESAQYEVRMRRADPLFGGDRLDDTFWTVLRSFTNRDPILFDAAPLARAALKIQASGQLSGVVDQLSVLAKSVVLDWDTGSSTWVSRASNNPASLFRHVLQGPANATPVPDAEIDLVRLQEWHDFCVVNGFSFNMVRDFRTSVFDALSDIAAAGRAGITREDGRWSVIIDQPQMNTVTYISPRNSRAFDAEKSFIEVPHAWKIKFPNEAQDYAEDERIVYRDGYDETNATLFEALTLPGVTDSDQAWKLGRYLGAVAVNRPEQWNVTMDFEAIVAKRGSLVKMTHDMMLVGLASGRIRSLVTDGGGNVTSITVDEELTMEAAKSYGLAIRRDVTGDVSLSVPIDLSVGTVTTVTPNPAIPVASAPEVGDLFGFGEFGSETEDAIVLRNTDQGDFVARVTMIPYRPDIYAADGSPIPAHVPNVTTDVFLPMPIIENVVTDESVLESGPGDIALVRAEIQVANIGMEDAYLDVEYRFSGENSIPFIVAPFVQRGQNVVRIQDVEQSETYDFRVRWQDPSRLPGPWTESSNVTIVGKSSPPDPLAGFTLAVFGGQVLLRWDEPSELDVQFGGKVLFRHSPSMASPTWPASTGIGKFANARDLVATLPLKSGSYLARVFDSSGNPSTVVSVSTKQASVLAYASVSSLDEDPLFPGTHSNTVAVDGNLQLDGMGLIDAEADFDAISDLDTLGGLETEGTYEFATGFDLGSVERVRLTTRITAISTDVLDQVDDRVDPIDQWEDFDGTDSGAADLQIWVRETDDDPAGSPAWSEFQRLDSAEFEARGFDFEARLFTTDASYNIVCSDLGIDVEEII